MNDELAQHHWWWLLFGLLTVAALMAALRAWLQTRQVPSVSLDPVKCPRTSGGARHA